MLKLVEVNCTKITIKRVCESLKQLSRHCIKQSICLICFPAWSLSFEPEEVAVDEAVSMDASDVGWGETPAATTDTGWATFDSFTDIRMAPSRFVHYHSNQRLISTLDLLGLE